MKRLVKTMVVGGLLTSTIGGTVFTTNSYALQDTREEVDIVIRVGEYPNKPGKRLNEIDENFNIDVPIRKDENGYHVQEWDLNYKVANKIVKYLESQGVNVKLQITESKSDDLNRAGKIAKESNPKIYLSIHHNSFKEDSEGYFLMVNEGDTQSSIVAKDISNAMSGNPMLIPQMNNRENTNSYIGELNQKAGKINILAELGFFSNPNEIKKCADDKQVDFLAKTIGNELINTLKNLE